MAWKTITVDWRGKSGKTYAYRVYELPMYFPRGCFGNFIYTRISNHHTWIPLYIGQGDLGNPLWGKPWCRRCLEENEATHIHVHRSTELLQRRIEVQDLLERYIRVFDPSGCNRYEHDFDWTARDLTSKK